MSEPSRPPQSMFEALEQIAHLQAECAALRQERDEARERAEYLAEQLFAREALTCCADERWRAVVGYEGRYEVSSCGRVRYLIDHWGKPAKKFRARKFFVCKGYPTVSLSKPVNGEMQSATRHVHTLVLTAFVGPRPPLRQCGHIDGNSANAHLSNLGWITAHQNSQDRIRHGTQTKGRQIVTAKLTDADALAIMARLEQGHRGCHIAKDYGVSHTIVSLIKSGKTWKHLRRTA